MIHKGLGLGLGLHPYEHPPNAGIDDDLPVPDHGLNAMLPGTEVCPLYLPGLRFSPFPPFPGELRFRKVKDQTHVGNISHRIIRARGIVGIDGEIVFRTARGGAVSESSRVYGARGAVQGGYHRGIPIGIELIGVEEHGRYSRGMNFETHHV